MLFLRRLLVAICSVAIKNSMIQVPARSHSILGGSGLRFEGLGAIFGNLHTFTSALSPCLLTYTRRVCAGIHGLTCTHRAPPGWHHDVFSHSPPRGARVGGPLPRVSCCGNADELTWLCVDAGGAGSRGRTSTAGSMRWWGPHQCLNAHASVRNAWSDDGLWWEQDFFSIVGSMLYVGSPSKSHIVTLVGC